MRASGDLVIGRSGDRKSEFTAETRRRGEVEVQKRRRKPNCVQPTRQVSGPDFSQAKKDVKIWALAPVAFKRMVLIVSAVLREIFDESAYDRFLLRTCASRSRASYREFTRERDAAIVKKPRCC